jgi:tetratricopeptide (TPR) repeat protein
MTSKNKKNTIPKSASTFKKSAQSNIKIVLLILSVIVISTIITYSPISKNQFLKWDDGAYVVENPNIKNLNSENLKLFFSQSFVSTYLPLTMISYAIDYQIGGLNPEIYTATNLIFHILNALLVFWLILLILDNYTIQGERATLINAKKFKFEKNSFWNKYIIAGLTALLFAIHPINVESVAWVAERKNVLFSFFFLFSLIFYIQYIVKKNRLFFYLSILLYIFSLLSKGVAVSLTLSVIAIDFVMYRNLFSRKVIYEKIPFLLLSILFGIIAFNSQGKENITAFRPLYEQIIFASYGFFTYIYNLIFPIHLLAFYPYPHSSNIYYWISLILSVLLIFNVIRFHQRISRLIIFSIIFFIANILFVIQIIPVGKALMADRYIYISSIGFFLILSYFITILAQKQKFVYLIVPIILFIYGYTAYMRVEIWNNNYTLWNDVIKKTKNVPIAWNNRGLVKRDSGNIVGAYSDFTNAINVDPEYKQAYNNLGIAAYQLGKVKQSDSCFSKAIEIDSTFVEANYNRGKLRKLENNFQGALSDLNKAIMYDNNYINAYNIRAKVKIILNDYQGAINDCDNAHSIDPLNSNAFIIKSCAYAKIGDYKTAISTINNLININKSSAIAYYIRAYLNYKIGNMQQFKNDSQLYKNLGFIPEKSEIVKDFALNLTQ